MPNFVKSGHTDLVWDIHEMFHFKPYIKCVRLHLKATKINKKRPGLAHSKAATANHKFSPTRELELSLWGWHRDYFAWIQLLCLFWINNSFTCLVLNQTNQTGGQQHIDTYLMASVLCLQLPISHPLCPPPGGPTPFLYLCTFEGLDHRRFF